MLRLSIAHAADTFLTEIVPFRGSLRLSKLLTRMIAPPPLKGKIFVKTRQGFVVEVEPSIDIGVDSAIYYNGTDEIGTVRLMQRMLAPGDWFVDVGSNIGFLTLVGAQAVGNSGLVWAFEPNPRTFIMLEKNVTLSEYEQIKLFKMALGSENSTAKIEFVPYHKGGATLIPGHGGPIKEDVKLQTLDSMIKQEQTRRIKLIKVDVEGWEYEFVKGAERILVEHSPILMLEYIKVHNGYYGATGEEMLLKLRRLLPDYRVFFPRLGASRVSKLVELKTSSDLPDQNNLWFLPREYWDYADKQV